MPEEAKTLCMGFDLKSGGTIEVLGLTNTIEENGDGTSDEARMTWRKSFDDGAMGCASKGA